jgi:thimet oligopeptidase
MHHLLGQTELGSFSGTHVKRDFVELPSQMLEEWLWDKDILKSVSSHYKTGEQLPDELIEKLIELKKFASGNEILRQCLLAQLSLDYYKPGATKDTMGMLKDLYKRMVTFIAFNDQNHFPASFGHLMDYGAKYYGYLWSRVFALDLFEAIKKEGLLNPVVGDRYVKEVIGRGGSAEPMELLKNFLGRTPNQEAFLKDLGL